MTAAARSARPGFAVNTLWTWTSVAANFAMAAVVSPLLIRRLGDEAYGLWVLVFSVVEYGALLDLGVRSAVVKYVAHYWALEEIPALNRTLNAAFLFLTVMCSALLLVLGILAPFSPVFFDIPLDERREFVYMLCVAGVGWVTSYVFLYFSACLEAVQRFDLSNRILIVSNGTRVLVVITLLELGFGLSVVVTAAVLARVVQCVLLWRAFHKHFPLFRWNFRAVDRAAFRQIFTFGFHTLPSGLASLVITNGPAVVIGRALPESFVGYYTLPGRLIQSVLDLVHRLGLVTNARASELSAHQKRDALVRLGIESNRYGLVIFLPAAIFLFIYGDEVFKLWLTPHYAEMSASLLPIFLLAVVFSDAGQFSSGSMLYALAKHRVFAWTMLTESVLATTLIYVFVQRADLWSAAAASAVLMVINRGFLAPYFLCRHLQYSVWRYIGEIAGRPLAVGVVVGAAMWLARTIWLPGTSVLQLAVAAVLCSMLFLGAAGRYCVMAKHQRLLLDVIRRKAPAFEASTRLWLGTPLDADQRGLV